jgi:hypothetical protein
MGAYATKQSNPFGALTGSLRGGCHRARVRATRSRAVTPTFVIARSVGDEAIQSLFADRWIASLTLAMTKWLIAALGKGWEMADIPIALANSAKSSEAPSR